MLSTLLRTRPRTSLAPGVQAFARWNSSAAAKPSVLILDAINLAKDELATLEKEATLVVSCVHLLC